MDLENKFMILVQQHQELMEMNEKILARLPSLSSSSTDPHASFGSISSGNGAGSDGTSSSSNTNIDMVIDSTRISTAIKRTQLEHAADDTFTDHHASKRARGDTHTDDVSIATPSLTPIDSTLTDQLNGQSQPAESL